MSRDRERQGRAGRSDAPEEGFAGRWSRMKRGAQAAPAAPPDAEAPPPDERSDEEILRELGLPDPDTLRPGDDIKGFMASAVPARIRNRVLRRLWISNPVLANLDGLVDYGDDFTDAAMVPAVLQTAYKVGRGWARDAVEEEPEAASGGEARGAGDKASDPAETNAPETHSEEAVSESELGTTTGTEEREGTAEGNSVPVAVHATGEAEEDFSEDSSHRTAQARTDAARRPVPRRMRFRFADN